MSPLPDGHGESVEIGSVAGRDAKAAVKTAIELHPWMPCVPEKIGRAHV